MLWLQIDGHVTVTYILGGANMSISEPLRLAADGEYHVVRFTRYGANATLQLDDLPTQTRNYSGQFFRHSLATLLDAAQQYGRTYGAWCAIAFLKPDNL